MFWKKQNLMAGICQEEKRRSVWSHSYLLHNIKFVFFPTHFFPSMKKKNNFLSFFVECLGYIQENCSVIGPTHLVFLDGIKNICWISFAIFCCTSLVSLNETRLQHLTSEMSSSRAWRQITLMYLCAWCHRTVTSSSWTLLL